MKLNLSFVCVSKKIDCLQLTIDYLLKNIFFSYFLYISPKLDVSIYLKPNTCILLYLSPIFIHSISLFLIFIHPISHLFLLLQNTPLLFTCVSIFCFHFLL